MQEPWPIFHQIFVLRFSQFCFKNIYTNLRYNENIFRAASLLNDLTAE